MVSMPARRNGRDRPSDGLVPPSETARKLVEVRAFPAAAFQGGFTEVHARHRYNSGYPGKARPWTVEDPDGQILSTISTIARESLILPAV